MSFGNTLEWMSQSGFAPAVTLVLVSLLTLKEMLRAYRGGSGTWIQRLNVAIALLLVLFTVIVATRVVDLI